MASLARQHQGSETCDPTSTCVSEYREFALAREDDAGMIFISCAAIPDLFIAVESEANVRSAIDAGLKNAFTRPGLQTHVYTNGTIAGPVIQTVVKLTK